jgi:predicted deacylase
MPHLKAEVAHPEVRRISRAFGTEIIIDDPGTSGMLRKSFTEQEIPTTVLEAGEPNKFERRIVNMGVSGVRNVMYELEMLEGQPLEPDFRVIVKKSEYVRVNRGGIINMKVSPRDLVYEGEELFSVTNPFGKETDVQKARFTGMVVAVTTKPIATPGTSIVHLVKLDKTLAKVEDVLRKNKISKGGGGSG